jgi:hypothetical protein
LVSQQTNDFNDYWRTSGERRVAMTSPAVERCHDVATDTASTTNRRRETSTVTVFNDAVATQSSEYEGDLEQKIMTRHLNRYLLHTDPQTAAMAQGTRDQRLTGVA